MYRLIAAALFAAIFTTLVYIPAAQAEDAAVASSAASSPHTFSANAAIASDYNSRGLSQTNREAAVQGGFDYAHSSGLYIGTWGSNVSWIRDLETTEHSGNSMELDVYGGYQKSFGDFGVDVGVLQFIYPGNYDSDWKSANGWENPNTTEGYVGVSWKTVKLKYNHAFTRLLGIPGSKGSGYLNLSGSYALNDAFSFDANFGHQRIKGPTSSYNDWKIGATYTIGGFALGLHYVDTNLDKDDPLNYDHVAEGRLMLSLGKSF